MKNTIILLILLVGSLKGFSRDIPDTTVPFSSIPIYYSSNQDSDRIIGLVSLGNGLWANKTFWAIDLKKDKAPINSPVFTGTPKKGTDTLATLADIRTLGGSNYALPPASSSVLGGVKVGSGLAVDGTGVLSATGGTTFNLSNEQYYGVKWVSGQTFTMPNTPTKFYYVQVFNSSTPMNNPYASYTWTSGTSVTVNETLQAGDSLIFHYDAGTANGTIASGTPQTGYVPVYQANGSVVWGAQSGGGTGGPTSISLATPNVLYSTPITYTNDGSGNWSGTLSLISQAAHKVFASPLASTGTPIFRYVDSADFGATGQFAAEVQAVPGFGSGSGGGNYAPKDLTLNLQTASYTAALSDDGVFVRMNLSSIGTFTIPTHASVALPVGAQINVVQSGAGQITITPAGGVTINSADGATKTRVQYSSCTLLQTATDTWLLLGDITN